MLLSYVNSSPTYPTSYAVTPDVLLSYVILLQESNTEYLSIVTVP